MGNNSLRDFSGLGSLNLRVEAKPFDLKELNEKQIESFREIIDILKAGVNSHDFLTGKNQPKNAFEDIRFNRVAFISGDRGTGKTSLLLTLKKYINNHICSTDTEVAEYTGSIICYDCKRICDDCLEKKYKNEMCGACKKICESCKILCNDCGSLSSRLVWLETLDMDQLPGPVNLLAAILARIEYALWQFCKKETNRDRIPNRPSPLEHVPEYRRVIMELQHLQQDVTVGWEGNILKQAPNIDPDTYATEVFRAERSRIDLNKRFRNIMKDLSHIIFDTNRFCNPIFLLSIDDFDLNPMRCVELIRLIRMVSAPNLITIILGDMDITRSVFNLKITNELIYSRDRNKTSPSAASPPRKIAKLANGISSNAIRKLIPPRHRVYIEEMLIEDAFNFSMEKDGYSIKQLLTKLPVQINTSKTDASKIFDPDNQFVARTPVKNISDFFNVKTILEIKEEDGIPPISPRKKEKLEKVYCARNVFRTPIRQVQDLWMYLKRLVEYGNGDKKDSEQYLKLSKGVTFARAVFNAAALEDDNLTEDMTRELKDTVKMDFEGDFFINTKRLNAENIVGPDLQFLMEGRTIFAHLAKDWNIGVIEESQGDGLKKKEEIVFLNHRTAAAIVFLHDLLVLKRPRGLVGPSLIQKIKRKRWVYARWDIGAAGVVRVPWLAPPWLSFWEHDFLRRGWNDSWKWLRYAEPKLHSQGIDDSGISTFLAYIWIKIGTIILQSPNPKNDDFYNIELIEYAIFESEFDYEKKCKKKKKKCKLINECEHIKKEIAENAGEKGWGNFFKMVPPVCEWLILVNKVHELASSVLYHGPQNRNDTKSENSPRRRELIRGWLARIACMLAPESGIPPRITMIFFLFSKKTEEKQDSDRNEKQNDLLKLWMEPDMARQIRTIRAKSAARFYNKKAFEFATRLFSPQSRRKMINRSKPYEPWPNKDNAEAMVAKEMELNWSNNYKTRRYALNILGNSMLCPVLEEIQSLSSLEKDDWKKYHPDKDYRRQFWDELNLSQDDFIDYMLRSRYQKELIDQMKVFYWEIKDIMKRFHEAGYSHDEARKAMFLANYPSIKIKEVLKEAGY